MESTLDRGQYLFQPIRFVNLVVPSPCETQPYNKSEYMKDYTRNLGSNTRFRPELFFRL